MKTFVPLRTKNLRISAWLGLLCLGAAVLPAAAQTVVDAFEYSTDDELMWTWLPSGNATVSVSDSVAPTSTGSYSMRVEFNFPSSAWATEFVNGPDLWEPVVIDPAQYVTFRIKGDPAFAAADFRYLYLYVYDEDGNFGRWGAPTAITDDWQVRNHPASTLEQPWNSPGLPDLSRIIRFAFYQYGSEAAIPAYTAAIQIDDLTIRDTPLNEVPVSTTPVIDDFEYGTTEELAATWLGSANAMVGRSTAVAPWTEGQSAMRVDFSFPSTAWATESVTGPELAAPVALGASQYLSFRIQGDPAFAGADFKNLYLYAYDQAGNFGRWGAEVPTTDDWQIRNHSAADIEKPWDSPALPDLGNLVKFAFFQYGSETAIPAYTASIQVDDLAIRDTPLVDPSATTEQVVEDFEYPTPEDLEAAWSGSANTLVAAAEATAPGSSGSRCLSLEFNFPSTTWASESVVGPTLSEPVTIARTQYVSFRVKGDPAFAAADFRDLYLYAYDDTGNFGRWGGPVPDSDDWTIVNYSVGTIAQPWNSPGLPNLERIVRFAFYQYGSEAAIDPYTATILIDDLAVRNTPLFPPASAPRELIDDFEGYADDVALTGFYAYQNSPETTVTTASLVSPAPQGNQALQLAVDFSDGQYPWGSVRSGVVAPFSLPTNAVVSLRVQGDPSLAEVADAATSFWLSFYDATGLGINFITDSAPVTSGEWTTLQARFQDFSNTVAVDTGNLVQWRILVQGWEGTPSSLAQSGTFLIDDIRVSTASAEPPALAISRADAGLTLALSGLVPGRTYELRQSGDLVQWSVAQEIQATSATATVPLTVSSSASFFLLREK